MTTTTAAKKPPAKATHQAQLWQARWFHLVMWLALFVLAMMFLNAVRPILLPFVLGGLLAYLMDPAADRLVHWGVKRGIAAALLTTLLFSMLVGLMVWLGPLLYHQLIDLVAKIPGMIREAEMSLREDTAPIFRTLGRLTGNEDGIPSNIGELLQKGVSSAGAIAASMLASAGSILNVIGLLLITPVVCFYFTRDWPGVVERSEHLLPRVYAPTIKTQLHKINLTLAAYVRGQLTVMLLLAVFYAVLFTLIGIKYAVLLGLLAGLLVIIPYIGTWISVGLGLVVAYGQFGLSTPWWIMLGIYVFGQIVESQILTPKIVGDRVGVHPLWLLFGMLAGGVLLGFVGVILAVPLTAVISVLVKFVIERYLQSTLYTDA
jgi:predicted PurR-regulated permease PerM